MTETPTVNPGMLPTVNDMAAGLAIVFVYVTRFGTVTEGVTAPWYLTATTDVVLPVIAAVWLLLVPTVQVLSKLR